MSFVSLREIQRVMQRSVLSQDPHMAVDVVARTRGASADDRMSVYVDGYGARLTDALRNEFPGFAALAGDRFVEIAHAYIATHPSHAFNVRWFGEDLPKFLKDRRPWLDTPAFSQMAELDWAIGLCFDAEDEATVSVMDFQNLAPDQWPSLRFTLARCVARLRFTWNVGDIRRAYDQDSVVPHLATLPRAQSWIVSRVGTKIFHRAVPDDESAALDVISARGTFAEVCERLVEWHSTDDAVGRVASLLRGWVDNGWIAELSVGSA